MNNAPSSIEGFKNNEKSICVSWNFVNNEDTGNDDYTDADVRSVAALYLNSSASFIGQFIDTFPGKALPVSGFMCGILPSSDEVNELDASIFYTDVVLKIEVQYYLRGVYIKSDTLEKTISLVDSEHESGQVMNSFVCGVNEMVKYFADDCSNVLYNATLVDYDEIRIVPTVTGTGTPEGGEELSYSGLAWCYVNMAPVPNFG